MLFRRKQQAEDKSIQDLDTKTYQYQDETYYVAQWPDNSRVAVSAHGETFHIYPKETESKGHPLFEVRDHRGYWLDTVTTPHKALESCCQRLQQRHQERLRQADKTQEPTAKERLSDWFQNLPEKFPEEQP